MQLADERVGVFLARRSVQHLVMEYICNPAHVKLVGYDYGVQQYVGYIMMASFIGGGNPSP